MVLSRKFKLQISDFLKLDFLIQFKTNLVDCWFSLFWLFGKRYAVIIAYYYKFIITYCYVIRTLSLHDCSVIITSLLPLFNLQQGNTVIMLPLLPVMQIGHSHYNNDHYYVFLWRHTYVNITMGPIVTHYYIFQPPEFADVYYHEFQNHTLDLWIPSSFFRFFIHLWIQAQV